MPLIVPPDQFNLRTGEKDRLYAQIIDEIIVELDKDKPNTMITVHQMVEGLSNPESFYGLLVGEIQSGKTPAQMILTWIFSRHPKFRGSVCFVTKNLDAIRRDIMDKFNSDLINRHIIAVCARHDIKADDAIQQFGLTYHIYTDHETTTLGQAGQVEIMLMQKDNFTHVRRWYHELSKYARAPPMLFLVDEMHEMYAGCQELVQKNGLTETEKDSNTGMLHWFMKKSQERRCYLIGVTATPYAPMTADPVCWPKRVYRLTTDAPAKGLTYYGYANDMLCSDITIGTYDTAVKVDMRTIRKALSRPRTVLSNGNKEVTFLCLSQYQRNMDQEEAASLIKQEFNDSVDILLFNQDNKTPLSKWFQKSMLTKKVCESGAIIIIGRACMAAGITIKPSKTLTASHEGVTYQVTGITDQFMPDSDINVTSTKQLMRILGWFPNGHSANLWLPSDELHQVYKTEMADVTRQFMDNYDPWVGPASLELISLSSKHIKKFYSTNPYSGHRSKIVGTKARPDKIKDILEVEYIEIDLENLNKQGIETDDTISSFFKLPAKQNMLKKALGVKGFQKFQIGYDSCRYNEIIEAALNPSNEAKGNNWQVNGFLWGPKGHESELKDCVILKFKLAWKARPTGENVSFQTPDGLWHYTNSKTMVHKSLKMFGDVLSKQHHLILSMMDAPEQNTIKGSCPTNAWNLFRVCFKEVHGSCEGAACSSLYKVKKQAFNDLLKGKKNSKDLLKAGCAIIN
jgi:hypothetical protein